MKKIFLTTALLAAIIFATKAQAKKNSEFKTKEKSIFYLSNAVNDSINKSDFKNSVIKSKAGNLKVICFDVSAKINNEYIEFSHNYFKPYEIMGFLTSCLGKKGEVISFEKIVATDGTSRKTYKGFVVYIK